MTKKELQVDETDTKRERESKEIKKKTGGNGQVLT